jgi:AcrR family transcriptional regulator
MGRPARVSREDVLRAAREAFGEHGFAGTTLADIAARIRVSPAALLRHAASKAELFATAMASGGESEPFPMAFLAEVDGAEDPARVLRHLAEVAIPYLEKGLGQTIAVWMHAKTAGRARTIRLPFDPRAKDSPPRRVLVLLEDYLRRAMRAGRIQVRDPRAAALTFMGSLNAYVFFHQVLRIVDPPLRLADYLDTVLDVWTRGAVRPGRARRKTRKA